MVKLDGWKSYLRYRRLVGERAMLYRERYLQKLQAIENRVHTSPLPDIEGKISHI